jgi:hypothetical protein
MAIPKKKESREPFAQERPWCSSWHRTYRQRLPRPRTSVEVTFFPGKRQPTIPDQTALAFTSPWGISSAPLLYHLYYSDIVGCYSLGWSDSFWRSFLAIISLPTSCPGFLLPFVYNRPGLLL